jgi:hypothetical protein
MCTNYGIKSAVGNLLNCFVYLFGNHRMAGFNNVNTDCIQVISDGQFYMTIEINAGRLFALT